MIVAPTHRQARYWAKQLGFPAYGEVDLITRPSLTHGRLPSAVYLVGTWHGVAWIEEFLEYILPTLGAEAILAEEMVSRG